MKNIKTINTKSILTLVLVFSILAMPYASYSAPLEKEASVAKAKVETPVTTSITTPRPIIGVVLPHSTISSPASTVNAVDDVFSTGKNVILMVGARGVLRNDVSKNTAPSMSLFPTEGKNLIAELYTTPARGILDLDKDGSFVYQPETDFVGDVSFKYKTSDGNDSDIAEVIITVSNDAPVAKPDEYSTEENINLVVDASGVLNNDTDRNGDSLRAELSQGLPSIEATPRRSGEIKIKNDGAFKYIPAEDFIGTDVFQYRACDEDLCSDWTTLSIEVKAYVAPTPDPIYGCTDSSANNYDVDADTDDDSCTYSSSSGPGPGSSNYNCSPSSVTNGSVSSYSAGCVITCNEGYTLDDNQCIVLDEEVIDDLPGDVEEGNVLGEKVYEDYPDGTLVRWSGNMRIYVIIGGARRYIASLDELIKDHAGKDIIGISEDAMNSIPEILGDSTKNQCISFKPQEGGLFRGPNMRIYAWLNGMADYVSSLERLASEFAGEEIFNICELDLLDLLK
jgi:Bacterial Ig domain